jgi:hypothetical protein
MKMDKKPTSLENLPEYLESLKKSGKTGGSIVVDTGQIVTTNERPWFKKVILSLMICVFAVGGITTYSMMSNKQYTVVVDLGKNSTPFLTIPKIVSDSGGEIISVTQKEDETYEVKLTTRKSRRSFLELFCKNKNVKKAKIEN